MQSPSENDTRPGWLHRGSTAARKAGFWNRRSVVGTSCFDILRSLAVRLLKVAPFMLSDIKKTLWATADKLRANIDAAEYKHLVLRPDLLQVHLRHLYRPPRRTDSPLCRRRTTITAYVDASAEDIAAELEDRDYYKEVNVFWVPGERPLGGPARRRQAGGYWQAHRRRPGGHRGGKPPAQRHSRQALRPRAVARWQAGRAGGSDLHHRLWRRPIQGTGHPGPGLRILLGPVCQRRRQERRPVLYARQYRHRPW